MKPALIIGSTCVDVIINIHHLPKTEEDIHPTSQSMAIGGCAFNADVYKRQTELCGRAQKEALGVRDQRSEVSHSAYAHEDQGRKDTPLIQ